MTTTGIGVEREVTLEDWLTAITHDTEHGVLTALKVHHWVQGPNGYIQGDEVDGRIFQPDRAIVVKEEAARMRGKCQIYAQGLGGEQTFKFFAYFGQEQPGAHFHLNASGRKALANGLTEFPDQKGMNGQGMRMGEIAVQQSFTMIREMFNVSKHLMAELKEDRDWQAKENREAQTACMTLIREQITNNHAQRMTELQFERSTAERQKLMTLLPAMLRFVFKDKSFISEGMGDTAIIEAVALEIRKMPREQQIQTMSALPQSFMIILGERIAEITKRQEAEEEQIRQLAKAKSADEQASDKLLAEQILAQALNGAAQSPQLGS
jgi:hypothetical protein